ncbi:MAG: NifB/NifX family molybdenum-iron cluster-binding protein [Phycisphaerae bacterium]|jgi:predicted Fe-Mo cluster-binding NifX family protein
MRLAIPCQDSQICEHFGHAPQFIFFEADPATGQITGEETIDAPPHQPGLLPRWLAEQGANVILAVGMGGRALELFAQHGVQAVTGVVTRDPREAAQQYLAGSLASGKNVCDH